MAQGGRIKQAGPVAAGAIRSLTAGIEWFCGNRPGRRAPQIRGPLAFGWLLPPSAPLLNGRVKLQKIWTGRRQSPCPGSVLGKSEGRGLGGHIKAAAAALASCHDLKDRGEFYAPPGDNFLTARDRGPFRLFRNPRNRCSPGRRPPEPAPAGSPE